MKSFLIALGVFAVFLIITATSVIGLYNSAVTTEKTVVASYDDMKNSLSQYSLKIAEMAQVPAMYRDDLSKVYGDAISGRYGKDGSKSVFNWIKEHNPNFDGSLYKQIEQAIEAGRNEFQNKQTRFIDIRRGYDTMLSYAVSGSVLRALGFPKIEMQKYQIIESDHAKESFDKGTEKAIQLRQ